MPHLGTPTPPPKYRYEAALAEVKAEVAWVYGQVASRREQYVALQTTHTHMAHVTSATPVVRATSTPARHR